MKLARPLIALVLIWVPASVFALAWEAGAVLGGGLVLSYGSYMDTKEAALAQSASSTPGKLGSSSSYLFPGWTAGGYIEASIVDWFAVRAEPRVSFMGTLAVAKTDTGDTYDQYGLYLYGVSLPVLARFRLALGPGAVCLSVGPFFSVAVPGVTVVDQYANLTTTAALGPSVFFGLTGGAGYSMRLGPGVASAELRADWGFTSVASNDALGGEFFPLSLGLLVGYGFPLGGGGHSARK